MSGPTGVRGVLARGLAMAAIVSGSDRLARAAFAVLKGGATDWADWAFRTAADTLPMPGRLTRPFEQHPTVHRALRGISRVISRVPIELFKKGKDEALPDHPLNRVLSRPNALMRGTQLIEATVLDMQYRGNALWWLGPPARLTRGETVPASIRRLDPSRTKLDLDANDEPLRYTISTSRGERPIPADQVLQFKEWNPHDESWGHGWVQAAVDEYEADWLAGKWDKKFFLRGAQPSDILIPKDGTTVSEEKAARVREGWLAAASNLLNPHMPTIIPHGFTYETKGMGHRDMDFVQLRRFSREQVLSASGMQPAMAGVLEYANYANMGPQLKILIHLEAIPLMRYIESVLNSDFLPRYDNSIEAFFKIEELLALLDELPGKVDIGQKLWSMGVPLEEINNRLELGMDLKKVPSAKESFLPFSVQPASLALEPPEPARQPESDRDDEEPEADEDGPPVAESARLLAFRRSLKGPQVVARSSQWLDAVWRTLVSRVDDLESRAHARWRSHLGVLRDEVLERLSRGRAVAGASGLVVREPIGKALDVENVLFDPDDAKREGIINLEPIWREAMGRGARTVGDQLGISIDFSLLDPRILAALTNRRAEIRHTTERIREELREALREGVSLGETELQLRERVLDLFGGERANARTLARTETFSAFSEGRFDAMLQAGLSKHQWLTSRDVRVRDEHVAIDREERPVGEPFSNALRYPLDPTGPAGQTINCRCVTIPASAV